MPASALAYPRILPCPHCGIGLAGDAIDPAGETICPSCRARFSARLFPVFWREEDATPARSVPVVEGEASCFFHPENCAARACERCGRFVCSVCEITVGTSRMCPSCLSVGIDDPKKAEFVPWRFLWADGALLFGVLPMIFGIFMWPMLPLTAITAIVFAILSWRYPGSIPRGPRRWVAVVGAVCGFVQIGLFVALVFAISGAFKR